MSSRTVIAVVLALICGVAAAIGVNQLRATPSEVRPETAPVVVAAADIPRGVLVTPELLAVYDWPKDLVPPGAVASVEQAAHRATLGPLYKNEPILEAKIAPRDAKSGMPALIPMGMRACTILARSPAAGVAGFILPGTRVDVLLTLTDRAGNAATGGGSTATLLQNVEVLAVNQELDAPTENKVDVEALRSVTLLVTPDQAAKLTLAEEVGTLHLTLRSYKDVDDAQTEPVTMKEIRFLEEPPLPPVVEQVAVLKEEAPLEPPPAVVELDKPRVEIVREPPPRPASVWTIRGNSSSVVRVRPAMQEESK